MVVAFELEEPENLAEMLENQELRRCGEAPLGPCCFSMELDRERRLGIGKPLDRA